MQLGAYGFVIYVALYSVIRLQPRAESDRRVLADLHVFGPLIVGTRHCHPQAKAFDSHRPIRVVENLETQELMVAEFGYHSVSSLQVSLTGYAG